MNLDGQLFEHYSLVPMYQWRWPHFKPSEIACRHCGELLINEDFLDKLEIQRVASGEAIVLSSAYRCPTWNAMVGGAPLSEHKLAKAGDQALKGRDRGPVVASARASGFTGIGFYKTFIHADTGRRREWGR